MAAALALAACAPSLSHPDAGAGDASRSPARTETAASLSLGAAGGVFLAPDGAALPLRVWRAEDPRAVVIALHGFNDYANAFALPGAWWAAHARITTYAYDQRGFGGAPYPGRWPGADRLVADLAAFVEETRARHPDAPIYVLGESMGAAVVIAARDAGALRADGYILTAPAVWGWSSMNPFLRASLWIGAHVTPGKTLSGRRLKRMPTDNIEILRGLARDPLVIKETRIDAMYGLVGLMERAAKGADALGPDALIVIGAKDDIIPPSAFRGFLKRICSRARVVELASGHHMLLRDREAEATWAALAAWMKGEGDIAARPGVEELAPSGSCS